MSKKAVPGAGRDRSVKRTRLNLYLSSDAVAALEELQERTGQRSMAETIRTALKLFRVIEVGKAEGKDFCLVDRKTQDRERIVTV